MLWAGPRLGLRTREKQLRPGCGAGHPPMGTLQGPSNQMPGTASCSQVCPHPSHPSGSLMGRNPPFPLGCWDSHAPSSTPGVGIFKEAAMPGPRNRFQAERGVWVSPWALVLQTRAS